MSRRNEDMLIHALMSAVAEGLVAGYEGRTATDAADFSVRFNNTFSDALRERGVPEDVSNNCRQIIRQKTTEPCGGGVFRVKGALRDREDPDVQ